MLKLQCTNMSFSLNCEILILRILSVVECGIELYFFSGLKANPLQMSRSKTSSDIQNAKSQDDSVLDLPKPMARFRSVENIASSERDTDAFVPTPAPRKSSITDKENESVSKPLPTPRRNVQSCYVAETEERKPEPRGPPPTAPRPQSSIIDRQLPPVPKSFETSDNTYSDIHTMDLKKAEDTKVLLAQMAKTDVSDSKITRGPPPVPKRTDNVAAGSILDEPVSPVKEAAAPDPFDTSAVRQLIPEKVPLLPAGSLASGEKVNSSNFPVVPPRPVDSSIPIDDGYISPISENFINHDDGLNEYGVIWPTEPGYSPPRAPPPSMPCPTNPPPPPPREDSSLPLPFENGTVQLPAGLGLAAAPPIPARPTIPPDFDLTNESAVFPHVPARPAPPPPVPRRPDC